MKTFRLLKLMVIIISFSSCNFKNNNAETRSKNTSIIGSWKLVSGTVIKGKDTTLTDYTKNQEAIKIINKTHFAFLRHDLGRDSLKIFVSGGGRCTINDNVYKEFLDYCNYREWENNSFEFTYEINGDTLITSGIEKVDEINVNHINIEKLVRIKE